MYKLNEKNTQLKELEPIKNQLETEGQELQDRKREDGGDRDGELEEKTIVPQTGE